MKNILTILSAFLISTAAFSQDCESIVKACEGYLKGKKGSPEFISDGQVYTAFLDREKAEFRTTLYGGSKYRIAASAGTEDDFVIFTIRDLEGNILFSNRNYKNAPFWDFKVESTLPVLIETELDLDKKVTGCAVMLIGFRQ